MLAFGPKKKLRTVAGKAGRAGRKEVPIPNRRSSVGKPEKD